MDIRGDRWAPMSHEEAAKEEWPSETVKARNTDSKVSISKCFIEFVLEVCVPAFVSLLLLRWAPENGARPSFHYS